MPAAHRTLGDIAVINLLATGEPQWKAALKASRVAIFLWSVARYYEEHGAWPTQADYASEWKLSERTARRDWATFREVFPSESSPERLAEWVVLQRAAGRAQTAASAGGLEAPPHLTAAA
jgi:hypothetical protein